MEIVLKIDVRFKRAAPDPPPIHKQPVRLVSFPVIRRKGIPFSQRTTSEVRIVA
jgi:hypothetical protein